MAQVTRLIDRILSCVNASKPFMSDFPPTAASNTCALNRWAGRTLFFCAGLLFATWGVHISTLGSVYSLDEAALGICMLAVGVGALLGLLQASRLIERFGLRQVAWAGGGAAALGIALLLSMPGFAALLELLVMLGAGS